MTDIFTSIIGEIFTTKTYLVCIAAALVCGLITAFAALYKSRISKGFFTSLVILPVIVATVITMVNGNIGTGVAVMGAFSSYASVQPLEKQRTSSQYLLQ